MHEVPIVHGMTVGEYAQMVNGEGWLENGATANLKVISNEGYTHSMSWDETGLPWIPPSPNIPSEYAAYLYPALCWFEPTHVSIGRGTHVAFTLLGTPWFNDPVDAPPAARLASAGIQLIPHSFTPTSIPGKSTRPKFEDQLCQGYRMQGRTSGENLFKLGLVLMQEFYGQSKNRGKFFERKVETWSGYPEFRQQIQENIDPEEIYASWQPGLETFKAMRKKYLLYSDFE